MQKNRHNEIEKLKRELRRPRKAEPLRAEDFLSSGSTLLNLACTGRRNGGFLRGKFFYLVGDSSSGKTWLSLTCLAEAARNKRFAKHRFIFDNAEDGALMDFPRYFGQAVADRAELIESETIEEFYDNIDDACKSGKPFIYVLDSMDSLSSEAENEKFEEQKAARRKGKQSAGSYGDGKAKKNSAGIRRLLADLRRSGSILIVISQTRDNLGFGFEKKTRSGGRALRFYATVEIWTAIKGKIKRPVNGKDRQVGIICEIQTKKNRINGKDRRAEIPIYQSVGIDDTGGNIRYLIQEGHWKGSETAVAAPEFKFKGKIERLIQRIESAGRERELQILVAEVWDSIEAACDIQRKRRYE